MSTRATYCIDNHFFYIHCDGYPDGAAWYFWNMLHANSLRGGDAEAFLRGNTLSSFTESHTLHTDTEYRYTLNGYTLTAYERVDFSEKWLTFFNGNIWDFINLYPNQIENYEPLTYFKSQFSDRVQCLSLIQVYENLNTHLDNAKRMLDGGHIGNSSVATSDAEKMCNLLKVTLDEVPAPFNNREFYFSYIKTAEDLLNTYQDSLCVAYGHTPEFWQNIRKESANSIR